MGTLQILPLLFIKVLIIDTGLSDKNVELFKYVDSYEEVTTTFPYHGPSIASIILSDQRDDWVCNNVRVTMCNFERDNDSYTRCLTMAASGEYDYVNMSLSGITEIPMEEKLLEQTTHNSIVVMAAGNDSVPIVDRRPGRYIYKGWGNMYVVTNSTGPTSNYGMGSVDVMGEHILAVDNNNNKVTMSGTSISAARYTHQLIQRRCRHDFNNDDSYNGFTSRDRSKPGNVRSKGGKQLQH